MRHVLVMLVRAACVVILSFVSAACGGDATGAAQTQPSSVASPSRSAAAAREVVVNDTANDITVYCADCPREGLLVQPGARESFLRVDSDYVRFEQTDGSATCIGYGTTSGGGQDEPVSDNELLVSQGGTCPAEFGRPS